MNDTMTVTETIHHGDYRNVRTVTVPRTWAGFVELLTASPYGAGESAERLAGNKYAAETFANLLTLGIAERGWATYQIERN